MKKLWKELRSVPLYAWIAGVVLYLMQQGLYSLSIVLSRVIGTDGNTFATKIAFLDDKIPLVPVFVVIYLYAFIVWIMGPGFTSLAGKHHFINYVTGLLLAYFIGFVIFTLFPTALDRQAEGALQAVAGSNDIFCKILNQVYTSDGGQFSRNLFPSFHCMLSTYCYLAVRGKEEVSKGVRIYSLVQAILVCLSTVFTKQHYIIDVPAGVLLAVGCNALMMKLNPADKILLKWQAK